MGLEVAFPCDREGVLALLPHRDPFVGEPHCELQTW